MNKCYFTGRTTKDVEVRYTAGEKQTAVGKFSLAVDTGYGDNKKANFFNMTAWGKTAEAMEKNVRKGMKIVVECEANQNSYTDKNGNKVNIPSYLIKPGDEIAIKDKSKESDKIKATVEANASRPVPQWLDRNAEALTAKVLALPTREQIMVPVEEHLIVELYSK